VLKVHSVIIDIRYFPWTLFISNPIGQRNIPTIQKHL